MSVRGLSFAAALLAQAGCYYRSDARLDLRSSAAPQSQILPLAGAGFASLAPAPATATATAKEPYPALLSVDEDDGKLRIIVRRWSCAAADRCFSDRDTVLVDIAYPGIRAASVVDMPLGSGTLDEG